MIGRMLVAFLLCLGITTLEGKAKEKQPPNILFILADDLGYEKLGCYGGSESLTPNLDRLAAEGMRFSRAYGSPVCTPTRMSLYTGQYPTRHGHTSVLPVHVGTKQKIDFKSEFPCYAQPLSEAGYLTSVTGKWQLATLEFHPDHLRNAGFDSWCVWQIWRDGAKTVRFWDPVFNKGGEILPGLAQSFGPDVLARYVVQQMKEAVEAEQPFLIHHNMLLPHIPIIDTPLDRETGSEASLDRMIQYMDRLVGGLVRAVDEMGIAEETCLIFLGDNGTDSINEVRETSAGLVRGGKRTLDDGGTHLPLIVRWKGQVEAGTVADDLVDVVDFFPTFCDLGGATLPAGSSIDGVSLAGRLLHGEPVGREVVVAGFKKEFSAFDGKWRLNSDGKLIDARKLPEETIIPIDNLPPEAVEAVEKLRPYLVAPE